MTNTIFRVDSCTKKNIGKERNNDSFSVNGDFRLYEKYCEISAQYTSSVLLEVCDEISESQNIGSPSALALKYSEELFGMLKKSVSASSVRKAIDFYVNMVNDYIAESRRRTKSVSGTSMAAVYIDKHKTVYPFSLGNVRIYAFHNNVLTLVSVDHTVARRMQMPNKYTDEYADNNWGRKRLTLYLGVDSSGSGISPQFYSCMKWEKGMKIILCSDGVYTACSEKDMSDILISNSKNYAADIVSCAMRNTNDNAACVVLM